MSNVYQTDESAQKLLNTVYQQTGYDAHDLRQILDEVEKQKQQRHFAYRCNEALDNSSMTAALSWWGLAAEDHWGCPVGEYREQHTDGVWTTGHDAGRAFLRHWADEHRVSLSVDEAEKIVRKKFPSTRPAPKSQCQCCDGHGCNSCDGRGYTQN